MKSARQQLASLKLDNILVNGFKFEFTPRGDEFLITKNGKDVHRHHLFAGQNPYHWDRGSDLRRIIQRLKEYRNTPRGDLIQQWRGAYTGALMMADRRLGRVSLTVSIMQFDYNDAAMKVFTARFGE